MSVKVRRKTSALLVAFLLLFSISAPLFSSPVYAVTAPEIVVSKDDHLNSVVPGQTISYKIDVSSGDDDATGVVVTETLPDYTTFNSWYLDNAVANGGFELGNFAGWTENDPKDGLSVVGIAHSGDYGLAISGDTTGSEDGYIEQELCPQVPVDAVSEFSLWGMTGYAWVGVEITVTYADSATSVIDLARESDGWPLSSWSKKDLTSYLLGEKMIKKIKIRGSQQVNPWDAWHGYFDDLVLKVNLDGPPFTFERCLLKEDDLLSFTFIVDVDDPVPASVDLITNKVEVSANGVFPVIATDEDLLNAAPDIVVVKDDGLAAVSPGGAITYTITVANTGNQDATGVAVEETVPEFTTFNAADSTPGWTCSDGAPAGTTCLFNLGVLAAGDHDHLAFAVDVGDSPVPAGMEAIENTVEASDDGTNGGDLVPGNNLYLEATPLAAAADLKITKSDGGLAEVLAGGTVVYTLSYANLSNQDTTGVVIEETVPGHTSFNKAKSTPGWSCPDGAPAGTTCLFNLGGLAAGASGSVKFAAVVSATVPSGVKKIANFALIRDDGQSGADLDVENNQDRVETPVNPGEILADATGEGEAVVEAAEEGARGEEPEEGEVRGVEEAPFDEGAPEEIGDEEEAAGEGVCRDPLWWMLVLLIQGILSFVIIRRSEDWEEAALVGQVIIALAAMIVLWQFFCTWWVPLVAIILGISGFYLTARQL